MEKFEINDKIYIIYNGNVCDDKFCIVNKIEADMVRKVKFIDVDYIQNEY